MATSISSLILIISKKDNKANNCQLGCPVFVPLIGCIETFDDAHWYLFYLSVFRQKIKA